MISVLGLRFFCFLFFCFVDKRRERVSFIMFFFCFMFFFLNIVLTWKFVGASKASVLYIYID